MVASLGGGVFPPVRCGGPLVHVMTAAWLLRGAVSHLLPQPLGLVGGAGPCADPRWVVRGAHRPAPNMEHRKRGPGAQLQWEAEALEGVRRALGELFPGALGASWVPRVTGQEDGFPGLR